jgi:hypothetical protein
VTGITECPSAFQVGALGTASLGWNGPDALRFAELRDVVAVDQLVGVVEEMDARAQRDEGDLVLARDDTRPMRMTTFARWDARSRSDEDDDRRARRLESVERDERSVALIRSGRRGRKVTVSASRSRIALLTAVGAHEGFAPRSGGARTRIVEL